MKCPTCESTAPHMHPAVQHEGEVEICPDEFHLAETPQNRPEYRDAVARKRASKPKLPEIRRIAEADDGALEGDL